jgi:hypothetical protein
MDSANGSRMHGLRTQTSPTPSEWDVLERLTVTTGHEAEVAELLIQYRSGALNLNDLIDAVRRTCETVNTEEPDRVATPTPPPSFE